MKTLVMSMMGMGLLISECAAQYPPPATPQAQFVQDYYECQSEAADTWQTQRYSLKPIMPPPSNSPNSAAPHTPAAIADYQAQLFQSCMKARGYTPRR